MRISPGLCPGGGGNNAVRLWLMVHGIHHKVAEIGIGEGASSGGLGAFVTETRWSRGTLFPLGRTGTSVSGGGHPDSIGTAGGTTVRLLP